MNLVVDIDLFPPYAVTGILTVERVQGCSAWPSAPVNLPSIQGSVRGSCSMRGETSSSRPALKRGRYGFGSGMAGNRGCVQASFGLACRYERQRSPLSGLLKEKTVFRAIVPFSKTRMVDSPPLSSFRRYPNQTAMGWIAGQHILSAMRTNYKGVKHDTQTAFSWSN